MIEKLLKKLGVITFKHRFLIIMAWLVLLVLGLIFGLKLPGLLTGGGWDDMNSSSYQTNLEIERQFKEEGKSTVTLLYKNENFKYDQEEYENRLEAIIGKVSENEHIEKIVSILNTSDGVKQSLIGKDEYTTIMIITMNVEEDYAIKIVPGIQENVSSELSENEFASILGQSAFWGEVSHLSEKGLENAHLYALPIILIVLLFVFRSVISALIPLALGVAAILVSFGILYFFAQNLELSVFVLQSAVMVGLGIGIDFSLILVMRFKEELKKHNHVLTAVTNTLETSGHAILFSGITIIGAMSTLFLVDIPAIGSIALGIIIVIFTLILASLTLLPALMSLLGNNINKLAIFGGKNKETSPIWYKISHMIMKRPIIYLVVSILLIGLIAFPSKDLKMETPDASMLPSESIVSKGITLLDENFKTGSSPIQILFKTDNTSMLDAAKLEKILEFKDIVEKENIVMDVRTFFTQLPVFNKDSGLLIRESLSEENNPLKPWLQQYITTDEKMVLMEVITDQKPASSENQELVKQIIRMSNIFEADDLTISVTGETARGMDNNAEIESNLLLVIGVIMILIYIILLITFRSIFLPLKAILINLLSLAATYGFLVMVFEYGMLSFVGIEASGYIQSFIPILLLSLLFSLSTDYEVFLLSRVKEEYEKNGNNEESVAVGLEKTAPMISGAALIMICVFLSFSFSGILPMQQLGLGMAVAIFLDATIIRLIIVPASMKLLGKWNWYFPGAKKTK